MPKKKITKTEEIIDDSDTKTYEQILSDGGGQGTEGVDKPIEEGTTGTTEETKDKEFDAEAFKEEIAKSVTEEAREKVMAEVYGKIQSAFNKEPEKSEKPRTLSEELIAEYGGMPTADQTWDYFLRKFDNLQQERQAVVEKQKSETQAEIDKRVEKINKRWDFQLNKLQTAGLIPSSEDPNYKEVVDQLFGEVVKQQKDLAEGKITEEEYTDDLIAIYHDRLGGKVRRQPAGADAPIAGVSRGGTFGGNKDYSRDDLKKFKSYEEIIMGGQE